MNAFDFTPLAVPAIHQLNVADFPALQPRVHVVRQKSYTPYQRKFIVKIQEHCRAMVSDVEAILALHGDEVRALGEAIEFHLANKVVRLDYIGANGYDVTTQFKNGDIVKW